ncbi:MAG: sigma-54-dependent Fis family transcriptional regulator [Planctomycetales bacterium]|nr:sigma-54-dependent Fis family transcriptional regulator [Planctomycetales bacterium]MCA9169681.1 sigma-54-dependent Fis family transcriptional regulator [Planctomycetales bacterium]
MSSNFVVQYFVGESDWADRTRRRAVQVSTYSYPVLISGASGTGKELIARVIHAHSRRSGQPFVPFHNVNLPAVLAAAQLFGQAPGVSRLAKAGTLGCLRAAHGGTLYIAEVANLDSATQEALLDYLRSRQTRRVGEADATTIDVRIIAATDRDLVRECREGRFNTELMYRLKAIAFQTIRLCERSSDLLSLASHMLARITLEAGLAERQLTPAALALLQSHDWPGNLDELEEVLEYAVAQSSDTVLDLIDFPTLLDAAQRRAEVAWAEATEIEELSVPVNFWESIRSPRTLTADWPTLSQVEAEHIRATLQECDGNLLIAAEMLGIKPDRLAAKMLACGIRPPVPRWSMPGR